MGKLQLNTQQSPRAALRAASNTPSKLNGKVKFANTSKYIRYRIPPSVVALKFSHGSVINFFCKFSKIGFVILSYAFIEFFKNF